VRMRVDGTDRELPLGDAAVLLATEIASRLL